MTELRIAPVAQVDAILDELLVAGVHVGFPDERVELAERLAVDGVGAQDVRVLAQHCAETVQDGPGAVARVLASILTDRAKRDARLADLRAVLGAKARRACQDSRAPGDAPVRPFAGPTEGEDPMVWEHDRMCRIAWCRVNSDRRPVAEVAAELGVKVGTITAMLDRGRVLSESPIVKPAPGTPGPAQVEKAERDGQARVREFRERMRDDRAARSVREPKDGINWDWIRAETERLVQRVRETGVVDLADVMANPSKRGALATLEADGVILRDGPPDAMGRQPYRLARNQDERAQFRAQLSAWNQRPRGSGAHA